MKLTVLFTAIVTVFLTDSIFGEDFKNKSFAEVRKSAESGNKDAQFTLGGIYEMGFEVRKDSAQAKAWYRKAAEQGHMEAWVLLGDKTVPCPKAPSSADNSGNTPSASPTSRQSQKDPPAVSGNPDQDQSLATLEQKAAEGDKVAQYVLGKRYLTGTGVPQNVKKGVALTQKSAAQGLPEAEYAWGMLIALDDATKGAQWIEQAAAHGDKGALAVKKAATETGKGLVAAVESIVRSLQNPASKSESPAKSPKTLADPFDLLDDDVRPRPQKFNVESERTEKSETAAKDDPSTLMAGILNDYFAKGTTHSAPTIATIDICHDAGLRGRYELLNPKLQTTNIAVDLADRDKGIDKRTNIVITCSDYRIKLENDEEWSKWRKGKLNDGSLDALGATNLPAYFRFERKHGKWESYRYLPSIEGSMGLPCIIPIMLSKPK